MRTLRTSIFGTLAASALVGLAQAAPVTFKYMTTVDATPIGLSAAAPVTIRYTFDPDTITAQGPFLGGVSYSPVAVDYLQIDNASAANLGNAAIDVYDNAFNEDQYRVTFVFDYLAGPVFGGYHLEAVVFFLTDSQQTALSSTSLPTTPDFAAAMEGNYIEFVFQTSTTSASLLGSSSFTLSAVAVPEASAYALANVVALGIAAGAAWKRRGAK